jgi:hypothetical protein
MPQPWMDAHEEEVQFYMMTTGKPHPPGHDEFVREHPKLALLAMLLGLLMCCCEAIHSVREHRRRRAAMDHED